MNIKRSILSFAITAVMLFTLIPVSAFAETQYKPTSSGLYPIAPEGFSYGRTTFSSPGDALLNFKATIHLNNTESYPYYYYWIGVLENGRKINYLRYRKAGGQYTYDPATDAIDTFQSNPALPIGITRLYVIVHSGGYSYTSPVITIKVNYPMAKPKITSIKKKSKTSIKIKWSRISNATGYLIYQSTGKSWKCIKTITKNTTLTYTKKKLKKGKKYYYCVRPYKTKGNTIKGPYSKYKSKKL